MNAKVEVYVYQRKSILNFEVSFCLFYPKGRKLVQKLSSVEVIFSAIMVNV